MGEQVAIIKSGVKNAHISLHSATSVSGSTFLMAVGGEENKPRMAALNIILISLTN